MRRERVPSLARTCRCASAIGWMVGLAFLASVDAAEAALILQNNVGQGADSNLGNDSGIAGNVNGGAGTAMEIRAGDSSSSRNRLGIVRWDISSVGGDMSGAIMRFYETGNNSRTVTVYGLNDGDAGESWAGNPVAPSRNGG